MGSFSGPEPAENEREKEADIPWLMQRTNKDLDTGLSLLTKARGLGSQGRRVSTTGFYTPEN